MPGDRRDPIGHVCVFEWRYGSEEMRSLFRPENVVRRYVEVEVAALYGLEKAGLAPEGCWREVRECAERLLEHGELARMIYEEERRIGHDLAALAYILGRECGECGKYVHFGLTSYDVVDTAWALILRDAIGIVRRRLCEVISRLVELAEEYEDTLMVGRTHGQWAPPITLGFKFANYAYELARSVERLDEAKGRVVRGKLSGPVGTMAAWMGRGLEVERAAMEMLGLEPHLITTQVAPRDGFAEVGAVLAIIAGQLERLGLEVRELSRPEIGEMWEEARRVGSSSMPHKRNPVVSERVCGLSRLSRGLAVSLLENIALMHERDLTNSALERAAVPHAFLTIDQMLLDAKWVLDHLAVDPEAMRRNLERAWRWAMSECLVARMVLRGVPRWEAHEKLWEVYMEAYREGLDPVELALRKLRGLLKPEDVEYCSRPENYLGNYRELIARAISYARSVCEGGGG